MRRPTAVAGLLFVFTLSGGIGQVQANESALMEKNQPAVTLVLLQDMEGQDKLLQEYMSPDKWLVVMFWASDCQVSDQTVTQYNKHFAESKMNNIDLLGISLDGLMKAETAKKFISDHDLKFSNLVGNRQSVTQFYGYMTGDEGLLTPTFLLFSPNGQLRARQIGAIPAELIEGFIKAETAQALVEKMALSN